MKNLIKNISKIYTPNSEGKFGEIYEIDSPEILIEDGKIKSITNVNELQSELNQVEIINAQGCCVLPGFIDPHTHPVFWQTREKEFIMRIQGKSYEEIAEAGGGIRNSARSFRASSKEQIKEVTKTRIRKFFEYGTTTIEAKSGYGLSTADEIKSLEIIKELNSEQLINSRNPSTDDTKQDKIVHHPNTWKLSDFEQLQTLGKKKKKI